MTDRHETPIPPETPDELVRRVREYADLTLDAVGLLGSPLIADVVLLTARHEALLEEVVRLVILALEHASGVEVDDATRDAIRTRVEGEALDRAIPQLRDLVGLAIRQTAAADRDAYAAGEQAPYHAGTVEGCVRVEPHEIGQCGEQDGTSHD